MNFCTIKTAYPQAWEALEGWIRRMDRVSEEHERVASVTPSGEVILVARVGTDPDILTTHDLFPFFDAQQLYIGVVPVSPASGGMVTFSFNATHAPSKLTRIGKGISRPQTDEKAVKSAFSLLEELITKPIDYAVA